MVYQIYSASESRMLAIMPMDVLQTVLNLAPGVITRVERETANNGVCPLFLRQPIPGFGQALIVGRFDEGRLA